MDIKSLHDEILRCRNKLKRNRNSFWENNKKAFCKNVIDIINSLDVPKGWKIYVLVSSFVSDKEIYPYDYDSWSVVNLIAATKKQGHEILVFINKSRAEFLSRPAIVPLILHEFQHIKQAAHNPHKYITSILDDEIAKAFEEDAEKSIRHLDKEFKKEAVLESVLYCYDIGGWDCATKMTNFLYNERENIYSGGYDKDMTDNDYELFNVAKEKEDINLFIKRFC